MITTMNAPIENLIASVIEDLKDMGYVFNLEGEVLHYSCANENPDLGLIRSRLKTLRSNRAVSIELIRRQMETMHFAEKFLLASDKAAESAQLAEEKGELERARFEWRRFARLFAACAEVTDTEPSDGVPWKDWVKDHDTGF